MDKHGWNVGEARRQFSELLERSQKQPQLIERRNRLIAEVIAMDETKVSAIAERVTIADRFEQARELYRREKFQLPVLRRRSR